MNMLYLLLALIAGAGGAFQAAINSRLASGLGEQPIIAALISFGSGTLILALIALCYADWSNVGAQLGQQPWWRWLGGAIGAVFVFTTILLAPRLGVSNTIFVIILGQLIASMCIDAFGLAQMPVRPVHWWKFVGLGLMLLGLAVFMFGDRLLASFRT